MATICGWERPAVALASCSKRAKDSWSRPSPLMTLMARVRPSLVSSALKTIPLPPSPSFFVTLYLPPWNDSNTTRLLTPLAEPTAQTFEQLLHDLYNHTRG